MESNLDASRYIMDQWNIKGSANVQINYNVIFILVRIGRNTLDSKINDI